MSVVNRFNVNSTQAALNKDFINVNLENNHETAYSSSTDARNAVPASHRKAGLQITYLLADGWFVDQYVGSDINGWETDSNWNEVIDSTHLAQDAGDNDKSAISQRGISKLVNTPMFTNSAKFNPYIKEIYISGTFEDVPAKDANLYIERAGFQGVPFLYIKQKDTNKAVITWQPEGLVDGYAKVTNGDLTLEFIATLCESKYRWNNSKDTIESSLLASSAFDINFSPTIKSINNEDDIVAEMTMIKAAEKANTTSLGKLSFNNLFVKSNKFTPYIKELYLSGTYNGKDVSEQDFYITRTGFQEDIFIIIKDSNGKNVVALQKKPSETRYHKSSDYYGQNKGVTVEIVENLSESPYNWNTGVDTDENSKLLKCAFDINYSPTIKAMQAVDKTSIKGKKCYFIGDSIMQGNNNVNTTLSLPYFIQKKYGFICYNKGIGGAILTSDTTSLNGGIYRQLMSVPDDADYIIMQGGLNGIKKEATEKSPWGWGSMSDSYDDDFNTVLQIPCLEAMCKYVITHFPTKKYGFIITYKISSWNGYWEEKSNIIKQVLDKWGIPYIDWRNSGITLVSKSIREKYGVDAFASYPEYSTSQTYLTDDRVIYENNAYKANQNITNPEEWTPEHWDLITEDRYDGWHCNALAYEQLADKTASWMNSL